ncbi:MAG: hypothetical protein ACLFUJ_10570 [Phycisphaerae bacterium]
MATDFSGLADDFYSNLNLQTTLSLPTGRETVLHFCEAVQKQFPSMTSFYQKDTGEYVLEGDRESGCYRWMELGENRLTAGFFNPQDLGRARQLHAWLLDRSIYFLGVSPLDVDAMDVLIGFNMDFQGNRDEIVMQALMGGSPLIGLSDEGHFRCGQCEPNIVMVLDEECNIQARLAVETRSNSYQIRTGQYSDDPISVYFTVRQYPQPGKMLDLADDFARQFEICEDLTCRIVLPQVVQPIAATISASS